jgi:excisionase family DNA binding protein
MPETLTPKQISRALDVSESSVKRWCDKGVIPAQYTAGGHRRIAMSSFVAFLRESKRVVIRPEVVGLPATSVRSVRGIERARTQLTDALIAGDEQLCRKIAMDLYLAEHSLSTICDEVFARAFEAIGDRWQRGAAEIYQERRGCEISLRVFHELESLVPVPPTDAPVAIGGAVEGDQYSLGTTMAELVLRDLGWNAISLGDNLPFETLSAAISEHRPRVFWLSCSHVANEEEFIRNYRQLHDSHSPDVAFVVGGRALQEPLRQSMRYAAFCDNMQHLESFARTLSGADGRRK